MSYKMSMLINIINCVNCNVYVIIFIIPKLGIYTLSNKLFAISIIFIVKQIMFWLGIT